MREPKKKKLQEARKQEQKEGKLFASGVERFSLFYLRIHIKNKRLLTYTTHSYAIHIRIALPSDRSSGKRERLAAALYTRNGV